MKPPLHLDHSVAPWWRWRWAIALVALALFGAGIDAGIWLCASVIRDGSALSNLISRLIP